MARSAVIAGASGLVGGFLLGRLLAHPAYAGVVALGRSVPRVSHDKLRVEIVNFDQLPVLPQPIDDVFCCLGTTIAQAGSQAAFTRVDHDYVVALAGRARDAGARRFLMVSALGANPASRVFYNRVKGNTERDVAATGLDAWFFRPSLLDGPRREFRFGERIALPIARLLLPLMRGRLRRYRPIHADRVAAAMVQVATSGEPGPGPIESAQIAALKD